MSKAVRSDELAEGVVMADASRREQLSALADGQLSGDEMEGALAYAAQAEGHATWQLYHLVGDVLRSSDLAQPAHPDFMARLRVELAKEAPAMRPAEPLVQSPQSVQLVAPPMANAANASVFRWKMVAGFASLAAVAAIGWTSLATLQGSGAPGAAPGSVGGAQLAVAPEAQSNGAGAGAPVIAVADADGGSQVMIRDPRLDELLAAHKQFGSTSALQMPAGFLRNATFETPSR